jgi:hypothetical protein
MQTGNITFLRAVAVRCDQIGRQSTTFAVELIEKVLEMTLRLGAADHAS